MVLFCFTNHLNFRKKVIENVFYVYRWLRQMIA